jgi:polysaccharide chain length determinant protein (PEP-CTERM system associated)
MPEEFLEEQPQLDIRKYWEVLRRRRWYFLLPFFVGWLAVWGVSWFLPSVYRSGTLILVEQPTARDLIPTTAASDLQGRLDSIQQQVLSRTRLLRIIDHLNLYAKQRGHTSDDDLVEKMRKDIQIELVRAPGKDELTAFNIYFSVDNPYTAQQVTTELTNILISENLEVGIQNSTNINKFLDSQLEEARKSLADQEEKVREFKDRYLGELPGQLQSNLQILNGLQGQLQAEEDALGRAKQQNAYFQSLVSQYRTLAETQKPGQPNAVGLPAINQTLDRLRSQLADLSSRYTDQYPDVRKVREQIAKTEKMKQQMIADLKAKPADAQASGNSATASEYASTRETGPLMEVESQLKANQIEIANRQRAIADLQGKINDYQARLNRAPTREQELTDLTRNYDQSRANYDSLLAKRNQSELATNLNKTQEGEHFRMIDPPSLPTKLFSPNRFKMSLGGLFAGLILGAVAVVGSEFLDDRMYDEEEFKKLLAVDIMAEIPPLPTAEEETRARGRFLLESAAVGVLSLITLAGVAFSYLRG